MIIQIEDKLVTTEIFTRSFGCDLTQCKGMCCVEGDLGAPVERDEVLLLEEAYQQIQSELPPMAVNVIETEGVVDVDFDGEFVTSIVNKRDCVFAIEEEGIYKCAIEKAYLQKKSDFRKPISCYLYPLRVKKIGEFTAINFHHWDICSSALCSFCAKPLYIYLKEPLIAAFGQEWYLQLKEAGDQFLVQSISQE